MSFKKFTQLLFTVLILPVAVLADGGMSSGGGASVVCKDKNNSIKSVRLLDLYEGQVRFGLSIQNTSKVDANQQFLKALNKVQREFFRTKLNEVAYKLVDQVQFLPDGVSMMAPTDLGVNFGIVKPVGCDIETTGYFESNGTLRISKTHYEFLSETDRAALIMHEALYKLLRDSSKETTSENTRQIVAMLFSTGYSDEASVAIESLAYALLEGHRTINFITTLPKDSARITLKIKYPSLSVENSLWINFSCLTANYSVAKTNCDLDIEKFSPSALIEHKIDITSEVDFIRISGLAATEPVDAKIQVEIDNVIYWQDVEKNFHYGSYLFDHVNLVFARTRPAVTIPVLY